MEAAAAGQPTLEALASTPAFAASVLAAQACQFLFQHAPRCCFPFRSLQRRAFSFDCKALARCRLLSCVSSLLLPFVSQASVLYRQPFALLRLPRCLLRCPRVLLRCPRVLLRRLP